MKIKPGGTHCLKISIFPRAPDFRTIYHCITLYKVGTSIYKAAYSSINVQVISQNCVVLLYIEQDYRTHDRIGELVVESIWSISYTRLLGFNTTVN